MESLAEGFLKNIPEEHRAIIAPYVRDWDGGVTRRFQQIHAQYEPYKQLGDFEELQKAVAIQQFLATNPLEFRERLEATIQELLDQGLIEMPEQPEVPPVETPKVPTGVEDDRLIQLAARMDAIDQKEKEREAAAREAAEIQELDNVLAKLHTSAGDFDDDWVILQISRGVEPEEAVKNWNSLIEQRVSSLKPKPSIPKVMRGSGSNPGGQAGEQKPRTAAERVAYMAAALAEAANQ